MIAYPAALQAVGGARTGIAPVNLLDVQDVNGNFYFWSDRRTNAPIALLPTPATVGGAMAGYPALPGNYTVTVPATVNSSSASGDAAASSTNTSGIISCGGGGVEAQMSWGGFEWPDLPDGAVVTAIQPVIVYDATSSSSIADVFAYLPGPSPGHNSTPPLSGFPACPTGGAEISGTWTGDSIGTTEDALAACVIGFNVQNTLSFATGFCNLNISSIGLLVSYSISGASGGAVPGAIYPALTPVGVYEPWLLTVPQLTFHRSSVTDIGSFMLQNLSGDTVSRDFEKIMRRSALEGAYFIYRCWQPDAQAAWIYADGTLTVDDVGVDTVTLKGAPVINPAQEDAPPLQFSETCQWQWGSPQCGAGTGGDAVECGYSYQTCQVPDRILVVLNNYEKNYGEAQANVPRQVINRQRRF